MRSLRTGLAALSLALLLSACDDGGSASSDAGLPQCQDGQDNDGDGFTDLDDPQCSSPSDDQEAGDLPACADGLDNDDDGRTDLLDPGCVDARDDDEADAVAECANGVDDDGDGAIDLADRGCQNTADPDESDDPPLSACANGLDDDEDGYTDFPRDPGCGSAFDDDERDSTEQPVAQCMNQVDDDNDGFVDLADPGCALATGAREREDAILPVCTNGLDDDGDGYADFPFDPGCSAAGDVTEDDLETPPACSDGLDNDEDGLTDYPHDPGCVGYGDRDELDPPRPPACADGVDNDRDGLIDYPEDVGCSCAADAAEAGECVGVALPVELTAGRQLGGSTQGGTYLTEGSCGGGGSPEVAFLYRVDQPLDALVFSTAHEGTDLESVLYVRRRCGLGASEVACSIEPLDGVGANQVVLNRPEPGEYYLFVDGATGRGAHFELSAEAVPLAACRNGIDDDGDGRVDYPVDAGCESRDDRDETDPEVLPDCADGVDNDGDNLVDYPADRGCIAASDSDEVDLCGQGIPVEPYPVGAPSVLGNSADGTRGRFTGSCGGNASPERVFAYDNPYNARLTFSVAHEETIPNTLLYVRSACGRAATELGCATEQDLPSRTVRIERAVPGTYFVFVDHLVGIGGDFKLSVTAERLAPACGNGQDDDGDGLIDHDDPGCAESTDEDERDGAPTACGDGEDNDEDGLTDYPFDPGCLTRGDADEADPAAPPACGNGQDDDEDGLTDYPDDPGCFARGDEDEANPRVPGQCNNRLDDDQDGLTDFPNDPGCLSQGGLSEVDPERAPACANGLDDDRDGVADFPFDPGCVGAGDLDETDPATPATCANGLDDDEDGRVDFPRDPGCAYAADATEADAAFPPQCANGLDDDGNGRVDWPDDPGCAYAADLTERQEGRVPVRCADGIDNDDDGLVDLADPGCERAEGDDELDPAMAPECGNGVDDDEDGAADWPEDVGCLARGDRRESQRCLAAEDVPVLEPGDTVSGETTAEGADLYRSRCGGFGAPDNVYRIDVTEPGDLLISADLEGTEYPVVLSLRRDCEEAASELICAGNRQSPEPVVRLSAPEPGEYFLFVDGSGPERWVSPDDAVIAMPADRFVANQSLVDGCGWEDGGEDAFDCYGLITVEQGGESVMLASVEGTYEAQVGAMRVAYDSSFPHSNVWRVRLWPAQEGDERPVNLRIEGNLGSDNSTRRQLLTVPFQGQDVVVLHTNDGALSDPPVTQVLMPSNPEQLGQVRYEVAEDQITISADDLTLPVTLLVAASRASAAGVAEALVSSFEVEAGAAGVEAPRFGSYELSVVQAAE